MRTVPILVLVATIALIAYAPVSRGEARAEILPIEDKDLAKMDLQETKQRREQHREDLDSSNTNTGDDSQCGSVAIGNSDSATQRGLKSVIPSDTTVIVTGNVYNTASCGR